MPFARGAVHRDLYGTRGLLREESKESCLDPSQERDTVRYLRISVFHSSVPCVRELTET